MQSILNIGEFEASNEIQYSIMLYLNLFCCRVHYYGIIFIITMHFLSCLPYSLDYWFLNYRPYILPHSPGFRLRVGLIRCQSQLSPNSMTPGILIKFPKSWFLSCKMRVMMMMMMMMRPLLWKIVRSKMVRADGRNRIWHLLSAH